MDERPFDKKTITVTPNDNFLTIRDTDKKFEMKGEFLKMITNKNYNVDLANLVDKKLRYEFAKEMCFDETALGIKSTRDKTLNKLREAPAILAGSVKKIFRKTNRNKNKNFVIQT